MINTLAKTSLAAITALAAASTAFASESMYLGAGVGPSNTRMTQQIQYTDGTTSSRSDRASGVGYKIFGGYRLSPHFGTELQYSRLGDVNLSSPADAKSLGSVSRHALSLSAIGYVPLTDNIDLLGKAGMVRTFHRSSNGQLPAGYRNGQNGVLLGLGAEYKLTSQLALRVEAEHMLLRKPKNTTSQVNFTDTLASVGMRYTF